MIKRLMLGMMVIVFAYNVMGADSRVVPIPRWLGGQQAYVITADSRPIPLDSTTRDLDVRVEILTMVFRKKPTDYNRSLLQVAMQEKAARHAARDGYLPRRRYSLP